MKIFYSVLISTLIVLGIIVLVINYIPFSSMGFLTFNKPLIGTTLTTLNSSDTMSAFPTLYNANNNALNLGKMETSTTSVKSITTLSNLSSVGTITSGVWRGTGIEVAYQGTGTTSPTLNQILLGNGSSGLKVVGGFGTSGQFLTSAGTGAAPTWTTSAIDQAADYTWTGTHNFNITTATTSISRLTVGQLGGASAGSTASTTVVGPFTINGGLDVSGLFTKGTSANVYASSTTQQTIGAAWTRITFTASERYDIYSEFSSPTFTATSAGYYQIHAYLSFNVVENSSSVAIYKNGSRYSVQTASGNVAAYAGVSIYDVVPLAAGDTIDIYAYSFAGNNHFCEDEACYLNINKQ